MAGTIEVMEICGNCLHTHYSRQCGVSGCACARWVKGNSMDDKQDETYLYVKCGSQTFRHDCPVALQLLIVDMGDCCVVKVEKGPLPSNKGCPIQIEGVDYDDLWYGETRIMPHAFNHVRSAIDAMDTKPVPRPYFQMIDRQLYLHAWSYSGPVEDYVYHAVCAFAGKDIGMYEPKGGGKWEQLYPKGSYSFVVKHYNADEPPPLEVSEMSDVPVSIWRFTKA
jgi:hypothetical protein